MVRGPVGAWCGAGVLGRKFLLGDSHAAHHRGCEGRPEGPGGKHGVRGEVGVFSRSAERAPRCEGRWVCGITRGGSTRHSVYKEYLFTQIGVCGFRGECIK